MKNVKMTLKMLSIFIIATLIGCLRVVSMQSLPRCERISTPICQQLGYNTTLMPNFMGHDDQREAALGYIVDPGGKVIIFQAEGRNGQASLSEPGHFLKHGKSLCRHGLHVIFHPTQQLQSYGELLRHNCSSFLRLFVCSVFFPLCSEDVPGAVPACRGLCEEVRNDCLSVLYSAGFTWPNELECSKFPEPPKLCMQQPSEDDLRDTSLGDHLHSLRTASLSCPPNTVAGFNQGCLRKCHINEFYTEAQKTIYTIWTIFWSVFCLLITTFSLLTFCTQTKRFRWPARPVLYLAFCGFLRSTVFIIRWIFGPFICSGATILEKPTDSLGCTSVALILVYTDVAACLWFCVFSFVWYLSAAKEWSTEAIEKISTRLHTLVWTLSTVPLIFILISRNITLNELSGFCDISSYVLVVFQLTFLTVGCSLAIFTSVALKNVRQALVYEGRCPYKLERLILRLGIISLGICVSLFFSLLCNIFEGLYAILIQVSLQFLSSIFASFWVFSSKTFRSWNKILRPTSRNKGNFLPSTKI